MGFLLEYEYKNIGSCLDFSCRGWIEGRGYGIYNNYGIIIS